MIEVPGLRYVPGYLESDVQDRLLAVIDEQPWHDISGQRRIQFYGYWSNPAKGGLYRVGDLPGWASEIAARLEHDKLMPYPADQLIVTEYQPGQGQFIDKDQNTSLVGGLKLLLLRILLSGLDPNRYEPSDTRMRDAGEDRLSHAGMSGCSRRLELVHG